MTFCGDVPMRAFHYVLCVKKVEHVNTYLYQYYYDRAERILSRLANVHEGQEKLLETH